MTSIYLDPIDDGLLARESGEYAKDKLAILNGYLGRFTTAMKDMQWRALNYIDLQAGPGKNRFSPSGDVLLGSPLLAMTTTHPFDNLYLVEMGSEEFGALRTRVDASDRRRNAKLIHEDCNVAVDSIVRHIEQTDNRFIDGAWPSLNLAFLDPEGLEIEWKTVEKLARQKRMDLIINFSTNGLIRNAGKSLKVTGDTAIDRFFGTREWRKIYQRVRHQDGSAARRELIDFYLSRLHENGYVTTEVDEKEFRNSKNVQVYTMIFACKNELGIKFWNDAVRDVSQPSLL